MATNRYSRGWPETGDYVIEVRGFGGVAVSLFGEGHTFVIVNPQDVQPCIRNHMLKRQYWPAVWERVGQYGLRKIVG